MTPQPEPASKTGTGFGVGLAAGLGVAVVVLLAGAGVEFVLTKKAFHDARAGWNLVPVVVAAEDVPEGSTLSIDMISQRALPEQFVTASVVKPDSANYVINQRVLVPLQAGDMLLWSHFETTAKKQAAALFLTRDVPAGALLAEADLEEREVAPALLTASWVTPKDRPQALGRKLVAPFRAGDPLLWTHFKAEGAP